VPKPQKTDLDPTQSVFINCPFDGAYQPILRAITFTVLVAGLVPVCALDSNDSGETRIGKIARMIGACDWGIHDLSRVEVEDDGVPRFNMPMELGIHLGAKLLGSGRQRLKRALILDSESHRYDRALSDISGQDIESHFNSADIAIAGVRNWLSEHRSAKQVPLPDATAILGDYRIYQNEVASLLEPRRIDPGNLTHSDFLFAVRDWINFRESSSPA
jgi:hypothetical protein